MYVSVSIFAMYIFDFTQNLSSLRLTRRLPPCIVISILDFLAYFFFSVIFLWLTTAELLQTPVVSTLGHLSLFFFLFFNFLFFLYLVLSFFLFALFFFLFFSCFFFPSSVMAFCFVLPFALCGLGSSLLCRVFFCFVFYGPVLFFVCYCVGCFIYFFYVFHFIVLLLAAERRRRGLTFLTRPAWQDLCTPTVPVIFF